MEIPLTPDELAHLIAEALEDESYDGAIVGEHERAIIRRTIESAIA